MSRHKRESWASRPLLEPVDHGGPRVRVGEEPVRFGRDPGCDVVISDLTVSRRHARLFWDEGELVLEDLDSSGGTFLNGERVQRANPRRGDVIRLGPRVEYRVDVETRSSTLGVAAQQSGQGEGVRHLQVLLEVARALNAATVLEEVLDIVLQAAVRLVGSDRGYLVLLGAEGGRSAVVSYPPGSAESAWVAQSSVLDRAIGGRETVVVGPGDGQSKSMVARGVSSALAAPLLVARHPMGRGKDASFVATLEVIGGILVERRQAGAVFSRDELAVFESLAADAALAIDSARLYRETREKAKIEHEMALARTIQAAMLREPPQVGFAEIHAFSQPARSVGGDLYFAGVRPDGAVVTAVGDVSGKGVAAALIMAMAQGLLALVTDLGLPFGELVSALDRNLATFNPGNRFLTLGACLLHPDGHLAAVNGGHCPLVVVRGDGRMEMIDPTGPVIGLLPKPHWGQTDLTLESGDTVVCFSDGISESFSPKDVEFGIEGVRRTLEGLAGAGPAVIGRALLDDAAAHREGREAQDDVTLLVVRYTG
jgi:serine phosphatase RsbU (regulator of sigma subunit)